MATKHGYARRNLGGGHLLKAVTRARRKAPRSPGKAKPLKAEPVWRVHQRRALEALRDVVETMEDREEAA